MFIPLGQRPNAQSILSLQRRTTLAFPSSGKNDESVEKDAAVDVLIAEDDELLRQSLRLLLELQGLTCAEAGNGREAVEVAHRCRPPLRAARPGPARDGRFAVPVCSAPTAHAGGPHPLPDRPHRPAEPAAGQDAGCERFLVKPVEPAELLEAIVEGPRPGRSARCRA